MGNKKVKTALRSFVNFLFMVTSVPSTVLCYSITHPRVDCKIFLKKGKKSSFRESQIGSGVKKTPPNRGFGGESDANPSLSYKKCVAARIHFGQKTPLTVFLAPKGKSEKNSRPCARTPVGGTRRAEAA